LEIEGLSIDKLRTKATELWEAIVKLETEKYDLEERQKRQDYDVSFYDSKSTENCFTLFKHNINLSYF